MIKRNIARRILAGSALFAALAMPARAAELKFRVQEISNRLTVGYATRLLDMNDDGKTDILVVDTERVVWFENPSWQMHTILEHQTKKDNVSIAPADIDGDGKIDFALAADWRPPDTRASGSLQWISRGKNADEPWTVHPIGVEPTIHRIRFADLDADGRDELIVVPLFGRNTTSPQFAEAPVRILSYKIPANPVEGPWTPQVINEDLHVAHNFWPTDLNADGKLDLLVASFEGVSLLQRRDGDRWTRTLLGSGNQATSPNRGASEIKRGRLASGADYLATIEPWHGFQVVVYTRPESSAAAASAAPPLWPRHVLDEELRWGHAVWCADLDGDPDEELVIGVRDTKDPSNPCGLRIYDPQGADPKAWTKHVFDPSGVAIEDLAVADLDDDRRPDIVAVGRATKNVRIYWNETRQVAAANALAYPQAVLASTSGNDLDLAKVRGRVATVLVSISIECPISAEYFATLNRIAAAYRPRGVNVIGLDPNGGESLPAIAEFIRAHKMEYPWAKDTGAKICRALGMSVTPEVCVFDAAGTAVYRGRIDDRYRSGARGQATAGNSELEKALEAVIRGEGVAAARTRPVGCPIQSGATE